MNFSADSFQLLPSTSSMAGRKMHTSFYATWLMGYREPVSMAMQSRFLNFFVCVCVCVCVCTYVNSERTVK